MRPLTRKPRRMTRAEERDRRRAVWLAPLDRLYPNNQAPSGRDDSFNQAPPRTHEPYRKPE